jgi:hypothetical protein
MSAHSQQGGRRQPELAFATGEGIIAHAFEEQVEERSAPMEIGKPYDPAKPAVVLGTAARIAAT